MKDLDAVTESDLARINALVREGVDPDEAWQRVTKEPRDRYPLDKRVEIDTGIVPIVPPTREH